MPSKRKRSGPGVSHRDDPGSSGSRPRFEGPSKRRPQLYRVPSKSIAGPGILVSCVQGRERKAALQFMDLLNETADRIYPGVVPTPLPQQDVAPKTAEEDEDDMDALRNGPAAATKPSAQPEPAVPQPAPPTADSDDIEAQIAAELQHIKASERRGPRSTTDRFRKVETDTECLVFISVSPPLDPLTLVVALLDEVAKTGEPGTRFVQRLSPVSNTCHADFSSLLEHSQAVLPRFFPPDGPGRTFKIDPRIRSHSTLHRSDVIAAIAQAIPTTPSAKLHTANLDNPDMWIVVEILKNTAAISVLADYDRYKKYNLQSVADAANQQKADQHDTAPAAAGRIATSLAKQAPVAPVEEPAPAPESEQAQPPTAEPVKDGTDSMAGFKLF